MKLSGPQLTALIANFSYILDIAAFAIILPAVSEQLADHQGDALLLYSAYGISLSATLILGGILTDRLLVKHLFTIGILLYATCASLLIFAPSFETLFILRALQGVGAALFSPCVPLLISRSGNADSAESLTIWGVWTGIVAAVSPILFSAIIVVFDWRAAWMIIPLIAFISLLKTKHIDESFRLRKRERKFPNRTPSFLILAYVFISYGLTSWFIYSFPLSAPDVFGISTFQIGIFSSLLWVFFAVTCWLMKARSDEKSLFSYLKISPVFLAIAAILFNYSPYSIVLVGIAMGFANMPTTEILLRATKSSEYGLIASLDITAARLGGALSVVLIPPSPWPLSVTMLALCAVMIALTVWCQRAYKSH